jgi:hypothetical protein
MANSCPVFIAAKGQHAERRVPRSIQETRNAAAEMLGIIQNGKWTRSCATLSTRTSSGLQMPMSCATQFCRRLQLQEQAIIALLTGTPMTAPKPFVQGSNATKVTAADKSDANTDGLVQNFFAEQQDQEPKSPGARTINFKGRSNVSASGCAQQQAQQQLRSRTITLVNEGFRGTKRRTNLTASTRAGKANKK